MQKKLFRIPCASVKFFVVVLLLPNAERIVDHLWLRVWVRCQHGDQIYHMECVTHAVVQHLTASVVPIPIPHCTHNLLKPSTQKLHTNTNHNIFSVICVFFPALLSLTCVSVHSADCRFHFVPFQFFFSLHFHFIIFRSWLWPCPWTNTLTITTAAYCWWTDTILLCADWPIVIPIQIR